MSRPPALPEGLPGAMPRTELEMQRGVRSLATGGEELGGKGRLELRALKVGGKKSHLLLNRGGPWRSSLSVLLGHRTHPGEAGHVLSWGGIWKGHV